MPKFTEKDFETDLIPEDLLKTISCSCNGDCGTLRCSCKKHGIKCTSLCSNCYDEEKNDHDAQQNCLNFEKVTYDDFSDSEEMTHEKTNRKDNLREDDDIDIEDYDDFDENFPESDEITQPSKKQKLAPY